jgi:hypothetical protein
MSFEENIKLNQDLHQQWMEFNLVMNTNMLANTDQSTQFIDIFSKGVFVISREQIFNLS